jgi:hypothetical protein
VIEYAALAWIIFARNIDACLLVQPPIGQSQVVRDPPRLLDDDAVRHEHRIDVARDPASVVSQRHGGTADDEHVRDDTPRCETLAQRRESPLKLGPAEENPLSIAHAASRSLADR